MTTAETLRELRKKKNVTQEEAASGAGIALTSYARYELGLRQPATKIARKLADYFGVSMDTLLGNGSSVHETANVFQQTIQRSRYEDLTPDELAELDRYADFIRSQRDVRKKNRPSGA